MKQYRGSVIVIEDDRLIDNIPFVDDFEAENIFEESCKTHISNFDEYTLKDIEALLEQGYEEYGRGKIRICWFS